MIATAGCQQRSRQQSWIIVSTVICEEKPCIKDSGEVMNNIKSLWHIPDGSIFNTVDMVFLHTSILLDSIFKSLKETLDNREIKYLY